MAFPIPAILPEQVSNVIRALEILKPVVDVGQHVVKAVADYIGGNDVELPELPETLQSEIETERLRIRSGL